MIGTAKSVMPCRKQSRMTRRRTVTWPLIPFTWLPRSRRGAGSPPPQLRPWQHCDGRNASASFALAVFAWRLVQQLFCVGSGVSTSDGSVAQFPLAANWSKRQSPSAIGSAVRALHVPPNSATASRWSWLVDCPRTLAKMVDTVAVATARAAFGRAPPGVNVRVGMSNVPRVTETRTGTRNAGMPSTVFCAETRTPESSGISNPPVRVLRSPRAAAVAALSAAIWSSLAESPRCASSTATTQTASIAVSPIATTTSATPRCRLRSRTMGLRHPREPGPRGLGRMRPRPDLLVGERPALRREDERRAGRQRTHETGRHDDEELRHLVLVHRLAEDVADDRDVLKVRDAAHFLSPRRLQEPTDDERLSIAETGGGRGAPRAEGRDALDERAEVGLAHLGRDGEDDVALFGHARDEVDDRPERLELDVCREAGRDADRDLAAHL